MSPPRPQALGVAEALAWGLVNRVTPKGTSVVDDAVAWIVEPIANGAPIAQAAALEAIDRPFDVGLEPRPGARRRSVTTKSWW